MFLYYFRLMIAVFGSGSVPLTDGSGSRRSKKHTDPDPTLPNCKAKSYPTLSFFCRCTIKRELFYVLQTWSTRRGWGAGWWCGSDPWRSLPARWPPSSPAPSQSRCAPASSRQGWKKPSPVGFFGFLGFFCFFLFFYTFAQKREFLGFLQFQEYF